MNKNKIKITKYITLTIGAAVLSVPTIAMVKNGKHEPN
jgi:hypothetical protein